MTKLLQSLIEAENARTGKRYPAVGSITTFTRGFGLKNDMRIAVIVNAGGGVRDLCPANVRDFRKYLASEAEREAKIASESDPLNPTLPPSMERVRQFIENHPKTAGCEAYVYIWPDVKQYGLRVAEIGLTKGRGGATWMQSDPACAAACFYAERLAIDYETEDEPEIADSEANLIEALYGAEPPAQPQTDLQEKAQ